MNIFEKIYRRFSRSFFYLQREIACLLGFYHSFFKSAKGQRIVIYHGICEKDPLKYNSLFITQKTFERHLKFYRKYFNVISLDDFFHKKFDPSRFNLCLAFDDGFANNFYHALPLLEKYKVPATFFVTAIRKEGFDILWNDVLAIASVAAPKQIQFEGETFEKQKNRSYVSQQSGRTLADTLRDKGFESKSRLIELMNISSPGYSKISKDYWLQMTEDEIIKTSQSPMITIGSHGYYHNDLARLPVAEMRAELHQSKLFLEDLIQKPVNQIAFPYGSYSAETIVESINAGYAQLYATEFISAVNADHSSVRERMGINPYISTYNQMYSIVTGNYA